MLGGIGDLAVLTQAESHRLVHLTLVARCVAILIWRLRL
jgi:hypothetical protein